MYSAHIYDDDLKEVISTKWASGEFIVSSQREHVLVN